MAQDLLAVAFLFVLEIFFPQTTLWLWLLS